MLARTMGRTFEELGNTCSAWEFGLHLAAYELDPWGPERIDLAGGIVASTLANIHRGKGQDAFKPSDFMPLLAVPESPPAPLTGADFLREFT